MSDIHDYIFFFYASLLLVVLKVAGFITWEWWVTAIPACLAIIFHCIVWIASR